MNGNMCNFLDCFRVEITGKAVIGIYRLNGVLRWASVENLDKIFPPGKYLMHKEYSPGNKCNVWRPMGITGRTNIQIEVFNYPEESLGCQGIGMSPVTYKGRRGVQSSRIAFNEFMAETEDLKGLFLNVMEVY